MLSLCGCANTQNRVSRVINVSNNELDDGSMRAFVESLACNGGSCGLQRIDLDNNKIFLVPEAFLLRQPKFPNLRYLSAHKNLIGNVGTQVLRWAIVPGLTLDLRGNNILAFNWHFQVYAKEMRGVHLKKMAFPDGESGFLMDYDNMGTIVFSEANTWEFIDDEDDFLEVLFSRAPGIAYLRYSLMPIPVRFPKNASRNGNLRSLRMSSSRIFGTIPSDLGSLPKLVNIDIPRNALSGSIPASLSMLTQLTRLDVFMNRLQGSIPSQLGLLTNLNYANFDGNDFENATIPYQLARALKNAGYKGSYTRRSFAMNIDAGNNKYVNDCLGPYGKQWPHCERKVVEVQGEGRDEEYQTRGVEVRNICSIVKHLYKLGFCPEPQYKT